LVIIVKKSLYKKNRIVSSSLRLLNLFYRDTLFISFKIQFTRSWLTRIWVCVIISMVESDFLSMVYLIQLY